MGREETELWQANREATKSVMGQVNM